MTQAVEKKMQDSALRFAPCVLVLDKPSGVSSFREVARVRRESGVRRVGHLGTLDPLATGVLVVAVGEATKLIEYFMKADKVYEATAEFGKVSDTYDREGEIKVFASVNSLEKITREAIEQALPSFTGEIMQVPPIFSALKIKGKPAYELARAGKKVELKARPVVIHALEILSFETPFLRLRIHCSSGTYIRSLVHDLGQKLGVGALMTELRRTRVGPFSLEALGEISLEKLVENWASFELTDSLFQALRQGRIEKAPSGFPEASDGFPVAAFFHGKVVSFLEKDEKGDIRILKNLCTGSF
ncbi:MAG: tRNA pseudouridine(55) synthase TruB [Candidatus Gracilibacteria bacterium]